MRPWRTGTRSASRAAFCSSSSATGSGRSAAGDQPEWLDRRTCLRAARPVGRPLVDRRVGYMGGGHGGPDCAFSSCTGTRHRLSARGAVLESSESGDPGSASRCERCPTRERPSRTCPQAARARPGSIEKVNRPMTQGQDVMGPVGYLVVEFPGNQMTGEGFPLLARSRRSRPDPHPRSRVRREGGRRDVDRGGDRRPRPRW